MPVNMYSAEIFQAKGIDDVYSPNGTWNIGLRIAYEYNYVRPLGTIFRVKHQFQSDTSFQRCFRSIGYMFPVAW